MPVSPVTEAEVALLYPHATNEELALAFRITARQVQHIGSRHKLLKTHETLSRARSARAPTSSTLTSRLKQAAADAGAAGLSKGGGIAAAPGSLPDQVERTLYKLTADGHLHRAGRKGSARWFAQRADADAFDALTRPQRTAAPAAAPLPAAVVITPTPGPAQQPGAPRIDADTRHTFGKPVPGPEGRWHTNAHPVFSSRRPGQYDDPASSWVAAVTSKTQEAR